MKRFYLVLAVLALAALPISRIVGQGGNVTPHSPVVVATYEYLNQTAPIPPADILVASDSGFYRVSTYATAGSQSFLPPPSQFAYMCPFFRFSSDFGGSTTVTLPAVSDVGYGPCIVLGGTGFGQSLSGAVPLHIKSGNHLKFETATSNVGGEPFSVYIVVEKL